MISLDGTAAEAASRLNLIRGRDLVYRGTCPCCGYAKPTLQLAVQKDGISISCVACGRVEAIAAITGLPPELLVSGEPKTSKVEKALRLFARAATANGSLAEAYLRGRGITIPIPASIRYLERQRNWADGQVYPAMVSRVERVPGDEDPGPGPLLSSGAHLTFLQSDAASGGVRKAATELSKLTLGQLRHGGVWLSPMHQIGRDLALAEGIETALSVMQITGVPAVAALSAAGMRSFRWPQHIRKLWIAADNDEPGLQAARALLNRALIAGLKAEIKVPAHGKNDFNNLLLSR